MDLGKCPHVDDAVWQNTQLLRLGVEMADGAMIGACIQGKQQPTHSPASYESALLQGEVFQNDPSDYVNGITRDTCFDDGRVTINVEDGRGWGGYRDFVAEKPALGIAMELSGFNNGADQPLLDQKDSTYNLLITSKGAHPITAAIYLHAWSGYRHGLVARRDAIAPGGTFLALYKENTNTPLFAIDRNGNVTHLNGRRVVVQAINGHDCLTLEG